MPYWAYHVSQKGPVVLRGEKSKKTGRLHLYGPL